MSLFPVLLRREGCSRADHFRRRQPRGLQLPAGVALRGLGGSKHLLPRLRWLVNFYDSSLDVSLTIGYLLIE